MMFVVAGQSLGLTALPCNSLYYNYCHLQILYIRIYKQSVGSCFLQDFARLGSALLTLLVARRRHVGHASVLYARQGSKASKRIL